MSTLSRKCDLGRVTTLTVQALREGRLDRRFNKTATMIRVRSVHMEMASRHFHVINVVDGTDLLCCRCIKTISASGDDSQSLPFACLALTSR